MNSLTRRRVLISAAAVLGASAPWPAEAATGHISMKILSAGFVFGAGGGNGVLTFRGAQYPFNVGGVSLGATIGVSGVDLVGVAHHLHDARDIEGSYSAAGAGVAVAGGVTTMTLSNARGVVLNLRGRQVGFKLSLALGGLTITLK
jgi:hypothetical protein